MLMEIPRIAEEKQTPEVKQLFDYIGKLWLKIQEQATIIEKQGERINALEEEINRLKKHKGRPKIKPSNMESRTNQNNSQKKPVTNAIIVKREEITVLVNNVPRSARFKGYQKYEVQELVIEPKVICYRLERWKLPSGEYVVAKLPESQVGYHFGPTLRSYIIYQNGVGVTESQILEQLRALGIKMSVGELNNLLIENKDEFHQEKDGLLEAGLSVSSYIHVDDTGARHAGKNGYCTHIGNELFAWFKSTESKSRINFLKLLRGNHEDYVINENALSYMTREKLAQDKLKLLRNGTKKIFFSEKEFVRYLKKIRITSERMVKIIKEGALIGSVLAHGFPMDLKIISDDAGQFNIFQHALCWIHAERAINRLIPLNEMQAKEIEKTLERFWKIYKKLKAYKLNPNVRKSKKIIELFYELCSVKTDYCDLKEALGRLSKNKKELLLVLKYPEIPLHNNLSERDIREYVKKRKISGGTRSDLGRQYRDTFISLKKTCRKLGINFWEYLLDRTSKTNNIPFLPTLVRQAAVINTS